MRIDLLSKSQLSVINKNNFRYPLAIAETAMLSGSENIFYKESLGSIEVRELINRLFACL